MMTFRYVYEQDYLFTGWPDDGGGAMTMFSWFDHDIANDVVIPLYILGPGFFVEGDEFFQMDPLTTEVTPGFFIDQDVFYHPMSARALKVPVQMLRNEVRRVR